MHVHVHVHVSDAVISKLPATPSSVVTKIIASRPSPLCEPSTSPPVTSSIVTGSVILTSLSVMEKILAEKPGFRVLTSLKTAPVLDSVDKSCVRECRQELVTETGQELVT